MPGASWRRNRWPIRNGNLIQERTVRLPGVQITDTPDGPRYLSFTTDFGVTSALKSEGAYSPAHARLAAAVFHQAEGRRLLVDIGAHIGTFSIPVVLATGCRVHAFEAQRVISQILGANFILNGIGDATVEHVALGAPGAGATLSIPTVDYGQPGNFGAFSVNQEQFTRIAGRKMAAAAARETVRAAALDDFALDDVFFIKLDVESAELDVLKGAVKTLERNGYPPLLCEAWTSEWYENQRKALLGFIAGLGYAITPFDGDIFAQHSARPPIALPGR
ncbi:MAG: FkbM family methyltransferase [Rhodospirillaceae bacterium]|nr:FkbM family methyltransferase [Rhodospirillaceae bacterium]